MRRITLFLLLLLGAAEIYYVAFIVNFTLYANEQPMMTEGQAFDHAILIMMSVDEGVRAPNTRGRDARAPYGFRDAIHSWHRFWHLDIFRFAG